MAVYYKHLFNMRSEISDSEGIVYSALVYRAMENSEFYNSEGDLDMTFVRAFIEEAVMKYGEGRIELQKFNQSKIAKETGMTRGSVIKAMERLRQKGILHKDYIVCPMEMVDGSYMELIPAKELTAQQKVFYSFLKDRSRGYGGTIDTWAQRLSEIFHTTKGNVYYLLSVLERNNYVERKDKKLIIK